jgi:hypothetical protein
MIELGQIIIHPDAERALRQCNQNAEEFLDRFHRGDWGDVDSETHGFNQAALQEGSDVLGAYEMCSGDVLWIIGDGKKTDVLLPI